jgi:histidine kinase/DNA gyrase B/HSP90-like ATPase
MRRTSGSRFRLIISGESSVIEVLDDGHGMTHQQAQDRYLIVGRNRRREDGVTSEEGRPLHGRKGIGKLAAFGTAGYLELAHTPGSVETRVRERRQRIPITWPTIRRTPWSGCEYDSAGSAPRRSLDHGRLLLHQPDRNSHDLSSSSKRHDAGGRSR